MAGSSEEKNDGLGRKKSVLRKTDVLGAGWETRLEEARARRAKALEGKAQPEITEPQKPWEIKAVTELPPLIDEETGQETDAPDLSLLGIEPKAKPALPPTPGADEIDAAIAAARSARIETKSRLDFQETREADTTGAAPVSGDALPADRLPEDTDRPASLETARRLAVVEAIAAAEVETPPEPKPVAWEDRVKEAEEINVASKPVIDAPIVEEVVPEEAIVEVSGVRWELVAAAVLLMVAPVVGYGIFMRDDGTASVARSGEDAAVTVAAVAPEQAQQQPSEPEPAPVVTAAVQPETTPEVEAPVATAPVATAPVATAPVATDPEPVAEAVPAEVQAIPDAQVAASAEPTGDTGEDAPRVEVLQADVGQLRPKPRVEASPEQLAALAAPGQNAQVLVDGRASVVPETVASEKAPSVDGAAVEPVLEVLEAEAGQLRPKPRGAVPADRLAALTSPQGATTTAVDGAAPVTEAFVSDTAPTVGAKTETLSMRASVDSQGAPSFPVVQPSPDPKPSGSADRALAVKGPAPADLLPTIAEPLGRSPQSLRDATEVGSVVRLAGIAPALGFDAVLPDALERPDASALSSRQEKGLQPAEPTLPIAFQSPLDLALAIGSSDPFRPDQTQVADQALVVSSLAPAPAQYPSPDRLQDLVPVLSGPGIELLPPEPLAPSAPSEAVAIEPGATVIYLHAAVTAEAEEVETAMASVTEATGFPAQTTPPFDFKISQTQVRFFHPEDREAAARVAETMSARLRSFTNFDPKPAPGTVELWLAGGGQAGARAAAPKVAVKKPAAPRRATSTRQAQPAPPPRQKIEATTIIRKRPTGLGKIFGGSGG